MDIIKLYKNYNIPYLTEGHKHCHPGWVHTPCPFCTGNPGYHLGFNIEQEFYSCWRCGGHSIINTIKELLGINYYAAKEISEQYGNKIIKRKVIKKLNIKPFILPANIIELTDRHKKYLIGRNFDPEQLENDWHIQGTGLYSMLDNLNYKHRIFIPVFWQGELVTFQTRDITEKSEYKYLMCPAEREQIPIKSILYGKQEQWTDLAIVVEGVTDVWRLGFTAVATFGIKYKPEQVRELSKNFKRIIVLFDEEKQAQEQADRLVSDLLFRGKDTFLYNIKGNDPGGLSDKEARQLVQELKTYKIK